jgi:cobalt-zinc-cadmium efflux system protein
LWVVATLVVGFAGVEWGVGYFSHSLTLLADSGHLLSDGLAIALSLLALSLGKLPFIRKDARRQIEGLAALANGIGLLLLACWIGWEAIAQLHAPPSEVLTLPMLITATFGLGINGLNLTLLHGQPDLTLRTMFLHVLADAIGSLGAILAAIAVAWQHWFWADGLISLFIAGLLIFLTLPIVVGAWRQLGFRSLPPEDLLFPSLEAAILKREPDKR